MKNNELKLILETAEEEKSNTTNQCQVFHAQKGNFRGEEGATTQRKEVNIKEGILYSNKSRPQANHHKVTS